MYRQNSFKNICTGVKHMAKVLIEEPSRFQLTLFGVDWPRYMRSLVGLKKTPRMLLIKDEINDSDNQAYTSESLAQNITLENAV